MTVFLSFSLKKKKAFVLLEAAVSFGNLQFYLFESFWYNLGVS